MTIFILGASVMQLPAIKIAKRLGWFVAVADANPDAPGVAIADEFFDADLKDTNSLIDAAKKLKESRGLDAVFTAGTDFSTSVAIVAEAMGLPGIPYDVALRAKNKAVMRKTLADFGIPVPRWFVYRKGDKLEDGFKSLGNGPWVVKPADNMGARGVVLAYSEEEAFSAVDDAIRFSPSGEVIIEDFIDGPEFSIDALVYNGEVHICGVADRHIYFPPYFVELGHTMPTSASRQVISELEDVFKKAVVAIGIKNGAAKGDVFYSKNGPVIGEIAARLSGGYMSGWTYPYSSGTDITEHALKIAAGLAPGDLSPKWHKTSAERAFISIPGRVSGIDGLDTARLSLGIKKVFCRIKQGDIVNFPVNNVQKCGNIISQADTRESATSCAEKAVSRIKIILEPDNKMTRDFLFFDNNLPWAFPLDYTERRLQRLFSEPDSENQENKIIKKNNLTILLPRWLLTIEKRDWHYQTITQILDELIEYAANNIKKKTILSGKFWRALLKGGYQGARWYIDTITSGKQPYRE
ncbi:ATP-grasp domain-containing protein [Spirochaetia bacterium 38H-sp]|uniref:ATP-grasp domain-containing protein n=1 Tax=Rarispira pelagica TaxID=3141764 RepID=A0ABU9UCI8_9SPIR